MRIALLMDLAPRKLGSTEAWLVALAEEARARGHDLDVFGRPPAHPEVAARLARAGTGLRTLDELVARPAAAVARLARYDVLHLDFLQPRSPAALLAYAAWPARVLFVVRSDARPGAAPAWRRLASAAADRVTLARVDSLAAVSRHVRDQACARFGLPLPRARVLYNGVDTRRFRPRGGPAREGWPTFVTVAHLVPHKGIDVLLRAFALARGGGARLRVVGDGPELPDLQVLARGLGLGGRVHFLGLRDDVESQLRAADAYVHPTLVEGFGNAVAEAMACGLPVVASRAGGIPEVVEDGVSGLLVPPGEVAPLARAIERVARDVALRRALGASARARVVERFSLDEAVAAHLDWCEERAFPAVAPRRRQIGEPSSAAAVARRYREAVASVRSRPPGVRAIAGATSITSPPASGKRSASRATRSSTSSGASPSGSGVPVASASAMSVPSMSFEK
jgi:glycosyltransferase involved in cell wall biosynthesis